MVLFMKRRKNEFPSQPLSIIERESFHAFGMGLCCQAVQVGNNMISFVTAQNLPSGSITELKNMFAFDNIPVLLTHNFLLCTCFPLQCFWGSASLSKSLLHALLLLTTVRQIITMRGPSCYRLSACKRQSLSEELKV